jgi:Bacterial extracellular solute-binding proteins, family 5 Middle
VKTESNPRRNLRRLLTVFALTGLGLTGCSGPPQLTPQGRDLSGDRCLIGTETPRREGQIGITLLESVDPSHLPAPHNQSEATVFRQCYETLVNLDCEGLPQPGLAIAWRLELNGRQVDFTLRHDGYFEDGSPVTAGAVVSAWEKSRRTCARLFHDFPWALIDSVASHGGHDRQLSVYLSRPVENAEMLFSHPGLAVYKPVPTSRWPLGSGVFRVLANDNDGIITCVANRFHRLSRNGGQVRSILVFSVYPGADPRDVLSREGDVMITSDTSLLEYVSRLDEYNIDPLPYRRLYLLVSPLLPRISPEALVHGASVATTIVEALGDELTSLRNELAQLVMTSDSEPASCFCCPLDAVDRTGDFETTVPSTPVRLAPEGGLKDSQVVYPAVDHDARLLAERLVGLSAPGHVQRGIVAGSRIAKLMQLLFGGSGDQQGQRVVRAMGLPESEFYSRLNQGLDGAYIVPITCLFDRPLLNRISYNESLDWFEMGLGARGGEAMIPLVMSRAAMVSRRQLKGVEMSFDGTVLFAGAGWEEVALP